MKWNFRKYFYVLLVSQFVVFLLMLAITYVRMESFSARSMGVLQEESYRAIENELRTRVDLVITHIESEMNQAIDEVSKIVKIVSERISSAYNSGGMAAVDAYVDEWLPGIHSMVYGHALEVILCNSKTGEISRYLGFGEKQDLTHLFTLDSFASKITTASVCQSLDFGTITLYICSNQSVVNLVVKGYVYDIIHAASYSKNSYTWVNEILNYEGGENYAVRVIHPSLKDTEGSFLSTSTEDEAGNLPYLQELEGICQKGEVFQRYFFDSPNGSGTGEKFSYAKLYKPFNWIIATGEQIEDVDAQANLLSNVNRDLLEGMLRTTMFVLLGVLVIGSVIIFILHHISQNRLDAFIVSETGFDDLTGLYNRKYFYEVAQELIDNCKGNAYIIRVNICNFKVINDLYGIEKGDRLLRQIGEDLQNIGMRRGCIASRFSADSFYIFVPKKIFNQLPMIRQINVPWLDMDVLLLYGVYSVEGNSNVSVNQMCDRADMAITSAKSGTGTYIHYYNDEFRQKILWKKEIEGDMEQALATGQFSIYIQPKYDVTSSKLVGGEALVRWLHPTKGLIPPSDFISLFEHNGFIRNLDYYVWESCCAFIRCALDKGLNVPPVSVNVSRIHFYGKELQAKFESLLKQYKLEPEAIELEVTETICAEDAHVFLETCDGLRSRGFKIAMDDFGSGYSSLNMLKELPLDIIKMDMRFLDGDQDPQQREKGRDILCSLIEMAHRLQLKIVVEGIETQDQVEFIKNIGRCAAQGYFYAPPMPAWEFESNL